MRVAALLCLLVATAAAEPEIEVVTLDAQPAIAKTVEATVDTLPSQIGGAIVTLLATAERHALEVSGPPFARRQARAGRFEVEVGLPVRRVPSAKLPKGVRAIALPAGPAATLLVRGRREDLPRAHARLDAWLASTQRKPVGSRWEIYETSPFTTPDPAKQETRIVVPLARGIRSDIER